MPYEQRDNSGSLFKNDKRESANHPHAKGRAMIDGKMYWVSAWTKTSKSGYWQSLAFTEMTEQGQAPAPQKAKPAETDDFGDSEIPF